MRIIRRADGDFAAALEPLMDRQAFTRDVDASVLAILEEVRQGGDAALVRLARRFDKADISGRPLRVTEDEFREAERAVPERVKEAVRVAVSQVRGFSERRIPRDWSFSPREGVVLGERFTPLRRVGCYVPGGTAPLLSTVIHTAALAATAGVPQIAVATPPGPGGGIDPAILHAARQAGATEVYRIGGVYAIGALAYGTESIPRVDKIVGPGNAYVAAAKRQVYGRVSLDLVAGPSEIMVVADDSADPAFVAADMLSQAEHGSGREQAVLVATDPSLLPRVQAEIQAQKTRLGRSACIERVLADGTYLVEARDLDEAAGLASRYAPEHLELMVRDPEGLASRITGAGAVFLGHWTPEPIGDFVAGPSHVLPTGGSGRAFTGLTVEMFFNRSSLIRYDQTAIRREQPYVDVFAACEGLDAHANSARIRCAAPRRAAAQLGVRS